MALFLGVLILGALTILQSAVLSHFPLLHGQADLVMLAVIAWSLQKRVQNAWHWGIIGGLLLGLVSALPGFVSMVVYMLAVGIAISLRQRVWQVPILAMFIGVFIVTLIAHGIAVVTLRVMGTSLSILDAINIITLPSMILNLLLSIPIYALLTDLANWVYPEQLEA
jgi:rod shape-determining protein MreD